MKELEIEFKNLLTNDEYQRLISHFNASNTFSQINYYIDTIDFDLMKNKCALRIRSKNDKNILTLKIPQEEGLLEINQYISSIDKEYILSNNALIEGEVLDEIIKIIPIKLSFNNFASIETIRFETRYKDGLLVLDHSKYLNTEDYELEFEVESYSEGKINFNKILNEFNIPKRETPNKIERVFKKLKKSNI